MNWPTIAVQTSGMLDFVSHELFEKEVAQQEKRFKQLRKGIESFQLICEKQFHPLDPTQIIAPAKLHRLTQNDIWSLWKVELMIPNSGLRPNQMPRMWFAVKGSIIALLCIASHVDNYSDDKKTKLSIERLTDIF